MIRSIFRVVECIRGYNSYINRREYLLYMFDALLMFLVMVGFLVEYPGGLDTNYPATKWYDEEVDLVRMSSPM